MSAVLVTGATGYIGRNLVPALVQAGYEVISHSSVSGDISQCSLPVEGVTQVIHLAGKAFVPASWERSSEYYRVNVMGTINVLEHCRRSGASLLFMSSYVYGVPERLPISEDHPTSASNPYSHGKLLAEDACRFYARQFRVPITIARLFNVYGGNQEGDFLIPSMIRQAIDPRCVEMIVQDETPRRDYIYIDDCIDLLLRMIRSPKSGTYNVGSGTSHSVSEIAGILNTLIATPKPLRSRGERRPNEIDDTRADITRAREAFDWKPAVNFTNGLARMIGDRVTKKAGD